jgi:hypothetical protein
MAHGDDLRRLMGGPFRAPRVDALAPHESNGHEGSAPARVLTHPSSLIPHPSKVPFRFQPIESGAFAGGDYTPAWLVKRLLVANQPAIIGGPQKALKTSLAVDLAVSLDTATPFLGAFDVYRRVRVAVLSGESGPHALQQTARRVCAVRGLRLEDLGVLWQFSLPQMGHPEHRLELGAGLKDLEVEVVIIDPLYLCLLGGSDAKAENLYHMGPLLLAVAQSCLDAGATPFLVHHATKPAGRSGEPLQLADLAFSGIAEFARQWVLIGRREPFLPGQPNRLWLSGGGSCGQGGLWALDIDEGTLNDDFSGRIWDVSVKPAGEERNAKKEALRAEKEAEKRRQAEEEMQRDMMDLMRALDGLGEAPATDTRLRKELAWGAERVGRVLARLRRERVVETYTATVPTGTGLRLTEASRRVEEEEG